MSVLLVVKPTKTTLLEKLRTAPFYVSIIEATIHGPKPVLYHYVDFENAAVANPETRECIACISRVEESSDHKEIILTFLFSDDATNRRRKFGIPDTWQKC